MLEIKNLNKIYDNRSGNFDISLNVSKGEVYGIVGPNGAGKSTLIRQILGFVKPDNGSITIEGLNPLKSNQTVMEFSGYISGETSLYDSFTGMQYLKVISKIKDNVDWEFTQNLLDLFSIDASKKLKKMSKGMKQKIAIIASIMHKPTFLVLDEPTSGLDVAAAKQFRELINKFKSEFNTTIIICSHKFDEVKDLCDRIGILKEGRLIKEINIKELTEDEINNIFIEVVKNKNVEDIF